MEPLSLCLEGTPEKKSIVPERQKVEDLIIALNETAHQIKNMDTVIRSVEDAEQQKAYAFQLLDIVKEYNDTYADLVQALEEYQTYEKEHNAPIDLNYRRLYRTLMESTA